MRLNVSSQSSSVALWCFGTLLSFGAPGCGGDEPVSTGPNDGESSSEGEQSGESSDRPAASTSETPASGTTTSDAVSSGTGAVTDEIPVGTAVGIGCTEDTDCASPLTCLRADDSFRGALPGTGVCSMPCESDEACQDVDALAYCEAIGAPTDEALAAASTDELPEGAARFCLQACPFGADSSYKCDGLSNFTCTPVDETILTADDGTEFQFGLCVPLCADDDDCETGESCDPRSGLCVDAPRAGKALGEQCDLQAQVSECAGGICMGIAEELPYGICSEACNLHPDTIVCDGEPGPDAEFACYSALFTPIPSSLNDLGQCLAMCDTDEDCPTAFACDTEIDATALGRTGLCWPTEESIANAVDALTNDAGAGPADPSESDAGAAGSVDGG